MSETAELADVVLPGSVWCEDEGTTTNLEGRVIKLNQAADPPGEARRDVDIICDLAARLGRGQFFPYRARREICDELRVASRGGISASSASPGRRSPRQVGCPGPAPRRIIPEHRGCSPSASRTPMAKRASRRSNMRQGPRSRAAISRSA